MDRNELVNEAERALWDAFATGGLVDLGSGDPAAAGFDPDTWGADRTVRAQLIARLLLGVRDVERGYIAKVRLAGALVTGDLDLNGGDTAYELHLDRCWLDRAPDLADAFTKGVAFTGCRLPGLTAHGLQTSGPAHLTGSRVEGELDLNGARIAGQLSMAGTRLVNPGADALNGWNLVVDQDLICNEGFTADGTVALSGAHIGGMLLLMGAELRRPGDYALNAQNLAVDRDMLCQDGFRAEGTIELSGAKVGGRFSLIGAVLVNPDGYALNAQNLVVERDVYFNNGFDASGTIDLSGARVGGQLSMLDATLSRPGGQALNAQNLSVGESLLAYRGFTATGAIDLYGSRVDGQISLVGATLNNPGGRALHAQSITVGQAFYAYDGFTASGLVDLSGAKIGGTLSLAGAKLDNPGADALAAENLHVDMDMTCHGGFTATGGVNLYGATVTGQLSLAGAKLANPGGLALNGRNLTVGRILQCSYGFSAEGTVSLANATLSGATFAGATFTVPDGGASTTHLTLDCESLSTGWLTLPDAVPGVTDLRQGTIGRLCVPAGALLNPMRLSGLTYTDLDPDPDPPVHLRLGWLRRDPDGYHPQPYEQLAAYYRTNGHDRQARIILLGKRRTQRRYSSGPLSLAGLLRRIPGLLIDALAGYGYVPARAFACLLTAIAVGTFVFRPTGATQPTDDLNVNALLLAIDAIIPTSPFGLVGAAGLSGAAYLAAMVLQGFGFALSIAVLPALTRTLARADK
ncbi:hypothetical protein Cs7R123_37210 [Catellatospora sp. TT07R-123]|uniref:hypothetical protein n=1 Tax=Catellatospora sp. TT07R-123 TaxID=2733863 RepID=UPI001B2BBE10|nr:hypothetical protein [Catellatospora sp. TT07R-123]GHJ46379.1 hypothetical protein Cs7R123_37210 [Catellatospora sp. TT07R-123]